MRRCALALALAVAPPALAAPPAAIVAMGDGIVAAPVAGKPAGTVPGGWVSVLADCLEERVPGRFTVVDRIRLGETAVSARDQLSEVLGLRPAVVLVSVGAQEQARGDDVGAFKRDLAALLASLSPSAERRVLLVGAIAPTADGDQVTADAKLAQFNGVLAAATTTDGAVAHVDLAAAWPADRAERDKLVAAGTALTDQGHARVGATVCDTLVASKEAPRPASP